MIYIVKASKMSRYGEESDPPFGHMVYKGNDFKQAKQAMMKYAEYGGVTYESLEEGE